MKNDYEDFKHGVGDPFYKKSYDVYLLNFIIFSYDDYFYNFNIFSYDAYLLIFNFKFFELDRGTGTCINWSYWVSLDIKC